MFKLKLNRKAQVAPFMVIIIVVIVLAIAAAMLIGEVGFSRLRLANISDGALLSSASGLCRSLNQERAISFGAGGLSVTWAGLQAYLVSVESQCLCIYTPGSAQTMFPVWEYMGQPLTTGYVINAYESIYKLHDQAEDIADKVPKNLREGIYDGILGGALIDEPKAFIESENSEENEVTRDEQGRITSLDYDKYLLRPYHFQDEYIALKLADSNWYTTNSISYSFNKKGSEASARPGVFESGDCLECNSGNYASYLQTNLNDVPDNMDINYQGIPLLYFYQKQTYYCSPAGDGPCCDPDCVTRQSCSCYYLPSFLYDPYAWISDIDIGSNSFGTDTTKRLDFRNLPFFGQQPLSEHRNKVRIKGNVWSGYDFGLEE